jgi:hypothetical protein
MTANYHFIQLVLLTDNNTSVIGLPSPKRPMKSTYSIIVNLVINMHIFVVIYSLDSMIASYNEVGQLGSLLV